MIENTEIQYMQKKNQHHDKKTYHQMKTNHYQLHHLTPPITASSPRMYPQYNLISAGLDDDIMTQSLLPIPAPQPIQINTTNTSTYNHSINTNYSPSVM